MKKTIALLLLFVGAFIGRTCVVVESRDISSVKTETIKIIPVEVSATLVEEVALPAFTPTLVRLVSHYNVVSTKDAESRFALLRGPPGQFEKELFMKDCQRSDESRYHQTRSDSWGKTT